MLVFLLFTADAFACGGFAPVSGSLATSNAQQALFELGATSVGVTYRANYQGNAADFAWVIAVPGTITKVEEGDDDALDAVANVSAPLITVDTENEGGSDGCGCINSSAGLSDKGGFDGRNGDTGTTSVTGAGFAGNYSYTTLASSDADSLITWLTDHGYDVSMIEAAVADYVADPLNYEFVAVQLLPDAAEVGEYGVALDALRIEYGPAADGELHAIFPAKMGVTSTASTVRTEWYVLSDHTATISGWSATGNEGLNDEESYDLVGPDYESAAGLYSAKLEEVGGASPTTWRAYSAAYGDRWLTRFDAIVLPGTNTVDATFADSGTDLTVNTSIYLQDEAEYEAAHPAWILPLGLFGFAASRRLRRRRES